MGVGVVRWELGVGSWGSKMGASMGWLPGNGVAENLENSTCKPTPAIYYGFFINFLKKRLVKFLKK